MLTRIHATPEQIEQIINHHLSGELSHLRFSYDNEDDIGFIYCKSPSGGILQWQWRNSSVFFSLQMDSVSYDVSYPEGRLKLLLDYIGQEIKDRFWSGASIVPTDKKSTRMRVPKSILGIEEETKQPEPPIFPPDRVEHTKTHENWWKSRTTLEKCLIVGYLVGYLALVIILAIK